MSLRLAVSDDVPYVMEIIRKVLPRMHAAGNYQWDEYYPTEATFQKDIKNDTLYVFDKAGVIKGCIVADDNHAYAYDDIPWALARFDCLALHRLAVDPDFQGRGLAQKILNGVIEEGKAKGYYGIHTDTSMENKPMQQLFEKLGFEFRGKLNLDENLDNWYAAYEKTF